MDTAVFSRLYKQLNSAQKEAVDTIEGPVMVIAGPGTGKTKILTLRIANILKNTDTAPESILALTFTESGVYSMRKNLVDIIGSAAYRVTITTFHGFCNDIIQKYPDEFRDIAGGSHISTVDQIKILEEIITNTKFNVLRAQANPHFYLYPMLKKIGDLKKDAIDPKTFKKHTQNEKKTLLNTKTNFHTSGKQKGKLKGVHERTLRGIERTEEFLKVYEKYEDHLKKEHLYDYDDMIIEVIKTLKENNSFLLELQEEYQYILADEHQDANFGQNTILELLSSFHAPYPNLFIVGDEKQAIFRFQGASLENFNYFRKLYPKGKLITLTQNYRSTQTILDAAGSVIKNSKTEDKHLRKRLLSGGKKEGKPIHVYATPEEEDEVVFVVSKIESLIQKGVSPGEIALLYRDNKDAFPYVDLLEKKKIPFTVLSDKNILDDPEIKKLITLFYAIAYFGEDSYLVELLHYDLWNIDNLDIYKVVTYAKKEHKGIFTVMKSKNVLKGAGVERPDSFTELYTKLSLWKKSSQNESFAAFFEDVVHGSGFMTHVLQHPEAKEKLENLERLYREAGEEARKHKSYSLFDFLKYIEIISKYRITIGARDKVLYQNSVQLMTAHRAKGLEYNYVFIVGVTDGHWGNKKTREFFPVSYLGKEESDIDDERRLFYVALTRAKDHIVITHPKKNKNRRQLLPSQFIEEIDKKFIEQKEEEVQSRTTERRFSIPRKKEKASLKEKEYLNELFNERGLSVTALNNYLKCPWRYFYVNLLRIPELETPPQIYGTAMHEAMKNYFASMKKKKTSKKELLKFFEESLKKVPLKEKLYEEFLKRGREALGGYYDTYHKEWTTDSLEEFPIKGVLLDGDIRLRGMIDRMVFVGNNAVSVIDYKTGKPRTRNYIQGATKDSTGDYKRQLVFYKLLLSLYEEGKFSMKEGVIDFLEPNERGVYKRESFEIEDNEEKELIDIIKKVATEIRELSFWDVRCDEKECQFCAMREAQAAVV
ncbi:hypothetical protein CL654_01420 [bacterium]|nr:hypothetical protein [bacterium]|tara:strand:- start:27598 stop:30576 length:2979 start_codon:yes stop_codon:yes gene_type:complete